MQSHRVDLRVTTLISLVIVVSAVVYTLSPFKRGYFANDDSLKYPYFSSTVSSVYLYTIVPLIAIVVVSSFRGAFRF